MIELYNSPSSTCSQKVRLSLAEKGIEFVDRRVNTHANEHLQPEYLKLNPNGVVPTLVHDGNVICDSSVICEYLEDVFPTPSLVPVAPVERAHLRAWLRFVEEVPTPAIRVPSFHLALVQLYANLDEERFRTQEADARPLRKHFYHRMGLEGFSKAEVAVALEELGLTLRRMEERLEKKGPWLFGDDLSIADIVVTPTIDRMNDLGLSFMWEQKYPQVSNWYEQWKGRPSFDATYYPGSRLSERMKLKTLDLSETC